MTLRRARLILSAIALATPVLVMSTAASARGTASPKGCAEAATVSNANDIGAGSLRAAIADVCAGGTIDFATRLVIDLESEIVVDKALTIDGLGQAVPIAEGENNFVQLIGGATHRVFRVTTAGDLTIRGLRFSDSASVDTGGAIQNSGRLAVDRCRFDGNVSTNGNLGGGAIFSAVNATLLVENSLFDRNSAIRGAGVFNSGQAELRNSTFSGNRDLTNEGAIQNRGTLLGIHLTVANNGRHGAGFGGLFAFNASTTLVNSVFADNIGRDCFFSGGTGTTTGLLARNSNCVAAFTADPALQPLAANGGLTLTHALLPTSIATGSGDAEFCLATDQRGAARNTAGCSLGAFEIPGDEIFDDSFEAP